MRRQYLNLLLKMIIFLFALLFLMQQFSYALSATKITNILQEAPPCDSIKEKIQIIFYKYSLGGNISCPETTVDMLIRFKDGFVPKRWQKLYFVSSPMLRCKIKKSCIYEDGRLKKELNINKKDIEKGITLYSVKLPEYLNKDEVILLQWKEIPSVMRGKITGGLSLIKDSFYWTLDVNVDSAFLKDLKVWWWQKPDIKTNIGWEWVGIKSKKSGLFDINYNRRVLFSNLSGTKDISVFLLKDLEEVEKLPELPEKLVDIIKRKPRFLDKVKLIFNHVYKNTFFIPNDSTLLTPPYIKRKNIDFPISPYEALLVTRAWFKNLGYDVKLWWIVDINTKTNKSPLENLPVSLGLFSGLPVIEVSIPGSTSFWIDIQSKKLIYSDCPTRAIGKYMICRLEANKYLIRHPFYPDYNDSAIVVKGFVEKFRGSPNSLTIQGVFRVRGYYLLEKLAFLDTGNKINTKKVNNFLSNLYNLPSLDVGSARFDKKELIVSFKIKNYPLVYSGDLKKILFKLPTFNYDKLFGSLKGRITPFVFLEEYTVDLPSKWKVYGLMQEEKFISEGVIYKEDIKEFKNGRKAILKRQFIIKDAEALNNIKVDPSSLLNLWKNKDILFIKVR